MCRLSNCSFHAKALYSWLLLALFLTISWNTPRSALCQGAPAAKTEKEIQVDALIVGIREHSKNAQWDLVVADCTRVLEIDPINTSALLLRGIAHNSKKNFDRAIEDFDSVGRQTARDSIAVANRADAFSHRSFSYYQKTEFLKAIDSTSLQFWKNQIMPKRIPTERWRTWLVNNLRRLFRAPDRVGINDKNAEAYSLRGLAYAATNNLPQAIADQNKAIALAPALAVAFQRRAEIHLAKNEAALASADIDQALRLNPGSVEALCDRAYLFGMQSKRAEAMADLDAAITIDPQCAKAHYIRGLAYMSSEDFEKAAACFDETIRCQEKHALAYCSRGYANHAQEKYEAALNDFTKAIDVDPKFVNAYQGRAKTYIKLKMRKKRTQILHSSRHSARKLHMPKIFRRTRNLHDLSFSPRKLIPHGRPRLCSRQKPLTHWSRPTIRNTKWPPILRPATNNLFEECISTLLERFPHFSRHKNFFIRPIHTSDHN